MDQKKRKNRSKKIHGFSQIEYDKDAPFLEYRNPQPDPISKQGKQKKTSAKIPKIRMKCVICKDKKEKAIEKETKKIEKYIVPISKRQIKINEERHKKEDEMFYVCKKEVIRLPSPLNMTTTSGKKIEFASAYKQGSGKVIPEKFSMTDSTMKWPPERTLDELMTKAPKSRIYINKTKKQKQPVQHPTVDSVDFIYDAKYRETHPWYIMYRAENDSMLNLKDKEESLMEVEECTSKEELKENSLQNVEELGEEEQKNHEDTEDELVNETNDKEQGDKDSIKNSLMQELQNIKQRTELVNSSENSSVNIEDLTKIQEINEESPEGEIEVTTKRHISKKTIATSIDSEYKLKYPSRADFDTCIEPNVIHKILQKYQRDSEMVLATQTKLPFKRGTLKSHSTSKLPKEHKTFYFGIKCGTIHFGDGLFPERSRYRQGLPMTVCAYAYSFVKFPRRWTSRDIDFVLTKGDKLYLQSLDTRHVHENFRVLQPEELCDVVTFGEKRIKYKIDEPEIAGFIKSEDPKVYNLLKGLTLFFQKNRSGILQSYDTNILIWKQKHFFVFDPEPRTQELYSNENGTTVLAIFYDIPSILVMLLDRGNLDNWPFIISKISIKKMSSIKTPTDSDSVSSEYKEDHLYKIINQEKAVLSGSISIEDECFGDLKNRLGYASSIIALVYSHVTPSCAWHKKTVDKVLYVSNQFYLEWMKLHPEEIMELANIPSFFTIGPLTFEIAIYANQYAGLMYQKQICLFEELLSKFFSSNTAAIVQIDKYILAIWKNRNMYYTFDPYSRDTDGFKCIAGSAVINMNANIPSVVQTVIRNFHVKDYIFKIHVLKVVKIHRDPEYEKPPRSFFNSEASVIESFKITTKTITIDDTERAFRTTDLHEPLPTSVLEIGSFTGSLDFKYVTPVPRVLSRTITKFTVAQPEKIYDLDSPSLSVTQIDKPRPDPLKTNSFEFRLLEEITREEKVLEKLVDVGEGEGHDEYMKEPIDLQFMELKTIMGIKDENVQKGKDYEIGHAFAQVNTDLLGLTPLPRIVLEPNRVPILSKRRRSHDKKQICTEELLITRSKELAKPSNFILLPDGSEILHGTKNITQLGDDYELTTPFVSIVAVIMAKKYTLSTWSKEVIDAVLDYGEILQKNAEVKFPQVPRIKIPKIVIGTNAYNITVDYMFDSLLESSILETCLDKLVFSNRENAIIVTQSYACAVFLKHCLYYMYDGFGCNLVGLGTGSDNEGLACIFRFKTLHHLVSRLLYNKKQREISEPTEASRFVISTVDVKTIWPESKEKIPRKQKLGLAAQSEHTFESNPETVNKEVKEKNEKKQKNVVGYHTKEKSVVIEGSSGLENRADGSGLIKSCHFISICAMIGLFGQPIKSWDTKRVDYVVEMGHTLFRYIDNTNFAKKRNIKNLLFDKHFFDIFVKQIDIQSPVNRKNLTTALDHLLKKNKYLLVQFPSCCFVIYNSGRNLHLFDPYGLNGVDAKACWIKFEDSKSIGKYFKKQNNKDNFLFYTLNISRIERASRKKQIEYRLRVTHMKMDKPAMKAKILHEDEEWLEVYPIPWSHMKKNLASGTVRGSKTNKWFNWDVEYPEDLYSLSGNLNQSSHEFSSKSRGKQTIANCIAAIVMTEIYDFTEWNSEILDSILKAGDKYFLDCFKSRKEKNYEIKVEDFKKELLVFPYCVNIDVFALIEGTMFLQKPQQFNLSKALRYFFEEYENRCGLICCSNDHSKTKYIAFGKIRNDEYFMYDSQTIGPPMFLDKIGSKSYILRCLSLNRLLHCLTLTLRGGDFFIYHVGLSDEQNAEKELKVVYNENEIKKENDATKDETVIILEDDNTAEKEKEKEANDAEELSKEAESENEAQPAKEAEKSKESEQANEPETANETEKAKEAELSNEAEKANEAENANAAEKANEAEKAKEAEAANEADMAKEAERVIEAQTANEAEIAFEAEKAKKAKEAEEAEKAKEAEAANEADMAKEAERVIEAQAANEAEIAFEAEKAKKAKEAEEAEKTEEA